MSNSELSRMCIQLDENELNLYQGIEKETFINVRPLPILEIVKPNG